MRRNLIAEAQENARRCKAQAMDIIHMFRDTIAEEMKRLEGEVRAAKKLMSGPLPWSDDASVEELLGFVALTRKEVEHVHADVCKMIEQKNVIRAHEELLRISERLKDNGADSIDDLLTTLQHER